jgi:iron complex outermembrane receptor protein
MNIPLYDIDRIEILKGPAALLFGSDSSAGGVVNYISKGPSDKPQTDVKATVGSFDLYRGEVSTAGPLGDTPISYRVTVAGTDSDFRRRGDYFNDAFVSTSVDYKISPTSKFNLYYDYYFLDQLVSTETVDASGHFLNISRDFSAQEDWANAPRYTQYLVGTFTSAITPTLQMRLLGNWSEQEFDFEQVFSARVPDSAGNMNRTFQNYTGKERAANFQVDFLKTFTTGSVAHKLTFGGAAKGQRLRQYVDNAPLAPINVFNPVYGTPKPVLVRGVAVSGGSVSQPYTHTREESAYVQEQATMFDHKLILLLGGGYNGVNTVRVNMLNKSTTWQRDQALVKRYGAIYKPVDPVSLYYSYSESFSFYNSTYVGGPRDGQIRDPSYTKNKEAGLKAETSDGRYFGSVVYFDMKQTNLTVNYTQPNGTPGVTDTAYATNKGWEADVGMNFTNPAGPLQVILTYYKGDFKDQAGNVPAGVSNMMWSAFASQSLGNNGALKGFKAGFGVYHKDDFTMSNATGQTATFRAPAYTTTTAFISYTRDRYSLAVNCDNLGDKKYVDGGDSAGALNVSLGRIFRVVAKYQF